MIGSQKRRCSADNLSTPTALFSGNFTRSGRTSFMLQFRQEVTRTLGGKDGLPDEWDKTAEMLRKTAETVLGVTFGKRKGDRETWWWNEEV